MRKKTAFISKDRNDLASETEIRKHYFLDHYVIVAPKRHLRPDDLGKSNLPHKTETPGSPAIEKDKSVYEIKDPSGGWYVKVIDNKFPALMLDNPKAYGKQEVIIETPEHNLEFSELPIDQIERVFESYINRQQTLIKTKGIRYVSVFKNDGPNAGASIAHAHSQVIALPIIPPQIEEESAVIQAYVNDYNSCPYCDIVAWEQQQKVRIIYEDKNVIAIAPYASKNPFTVWMIPKKHHPHFADLSRNEKHSFAVILKNIAAFLDANSISFNFFLQDSLPPYNHHFILKIEPRQTVWAGLEISTGVILNPVPPETAVLWYKGKLR